LIRDILDLSALESGELRLSRQSADVLQIAAEVVKEVGIAAEKKGLTLDLLGSPAEAHVDPVRVRQIVSNLVGNAVKFTSKGSVGVFVSKDVEQVTITVTDTGPGIAAAEQAAIFEEYQQVGDPKKRTAGTGLGLAITRRLVKMHGGRIELVSALGEGSKFSVILPIESAEEEAAPSRPSGFHSEPRSKEKNPLPQTSDVRTLRGLVPPARDKGERS
jgi:signal transduction histidine kinase